jgi:4-hydroxy-3-polyprenylbenzoate decarboxylase
LYSALHSWTGSYKDGEDGEDGDEEERKDWEDGAAGKARLEETRSSLALPVFSVLSVLSVFHTASTASPYSYPQPTGPVTQYPVVLALTGASGAPYGVRLLEVLVRSRVPVWLIASEHGLRLLREECGIDSLESLRRTTGNDWTSVVTFPDEDRGALPASGSQRTSGMVICPCSMGTVAAIAIGASRSLVERAADVTLKEHRKLILVPRETPLSLVHLRNLVAAAEAGARVVPASPGFYHRPTQVTELVDFVVQRILDQLGLEIEIARRWGADSR